MKIFLFIGSFLLASIFAVAQTESGKGFSLGGGVGYTNDRIIAPEIFGKLDFMVRTIPANIRFGFNYHPFEAQFQGLNKLKTEGIGLFAEGDVYPFRKYLFAGIRWDLFTFNWLTDSALKSIRTDLSFIGFSGTNFYGVIGIDLPVFRNISFFLYGMPGVQQYKISDGEFSSGSYVANGSGQENHTRFVYQFNATIIAKIK